MANLILQSVYHILEIYWYVLVARFILSWLPDMESTALGKWIYRLTEFYFAPFRRIIPSIRMGMAYLDLSMMVGFIAYWFLEQGILYVLQLVFGMVA
ncbi:YggT family protein [Fodinisporobacter ferrooxydans]|uniref:YggT family protein n=1 Tax=Fodinisporobacter ferrooxydans TaxID=2901836 RepID=A0ABY4CF63_9BACL|nr:YggT family protein [Alicyclobacillaceae bacterium MYW30-H2]